jgi:hypothetical protein
VNNTAGGGARWLDVAPARYPGWIASFAARHSAGAADPFLAMTLTSELVTFIAPDGAVAECHPPFPPLPPFPATPDTTATPAAPTAPATPATSTTPATSATPVTSVTPTTPVTPQTPTASATPATPAAPTTPQTPTAPATPATLATPATSAAPATPATLATPTAPTTLATIGAADVGAVTEAIAAHALRPRAVGVLLVRLGGYAAGVFTGSPPRLAASKTGSRPVHGRSAAGGWSQHRFARRREKQASEALAAAADAAVTVFGSWGGASRERSGSQITARGGHAKGGQAGGGHAGGGQAGGERGRLDAVVLGGDKRAMADLAADPRLAPYLALATDRFLTVPDPRRAVLEDTPRLFLAVRIRLTEPAP